MKIWLAAKHINNEQIIDYRIMIYLVNFLIKQFNIQAKEELV